METGQDRFMRKLPRLESRYNVPRSEIYAVQKEQNFGYIEMKTILESYRSASTRYGLEMELDFHSFMAIARESGMLRKDGIDYSEMDATMRQVAPWLNQLKQNPNFDEKLRELFPKSIDESVRGGLKVYEKYRLGAPSSDSGIYDTTMNR